MTAFVPLRRRTALKFMAAAALTPAAARAQANGLSRDQYRKMTVIDAKGFLREGDPRIPPGAPLSANFLTAASASGLTMISATQGGSGTMEALVASTKRADGLIAGSKGALVKVLTAADIAAAKAKGALGVAYDVQGTSEIGKDAANAARLKELGIRTVQLTYNLKALTGDGCIVPEDGGLTAFGRDVIAEIERLRLLLDLSHVGKRTAADAVAASKAIPAITHAGCDAVTPHPRHVPDATLRALAEKGGVFGLYFMPYLRVKGQADKEDLIRHIEHAIKVCGEDHVGIGTDGNVPQLELTPEYREYWRKDVYEPRVKNGTVAPNEGADIFNYIPEYNPADRYYLLGDDLVRRGHSTARVEKILGGNFARLYRTVWA